MDAKAYEESKRNWEQEQQRMDEPEIDWGDIADLRQTRPVPPLPTMEQLQEVIDNRYEAPISQPVGFSPRVQSIVEALYPRENYIGAGVTR